MDYHLKVDHLIRCGNKIYVPDDKELNNLILRKFHVKLYLGHLGYDTTLSKVNKFQYWSNLKKEVVDFVTRCLDC